jgi:hypothetical protein
MRPGQRPHPSQRVARYTGFEEMLDAEGPEKVDPATPRDQQLATFVASTARRRKP